ncbi:MAG: hypothetical protein NTW21_06720 [Verrucomicrobia bacterium]|nr:hypothetical protein [Verrucomicrobiota bacterium]
MSQELFRQLNDAPGGLVDQGAAARISRVISKATPRAAAPCWPLKHSLIEDGDGVRALTPTI